MGTTWVKRSLNVGALTAGALLVSGAAAQAGGDLAGDPQAAPDTRARLPLESPISVCDDLAAVTALADEVCAGAASALQPEWTNAHFLSGGRPLADPGSPLTRPVPARGVAPMAADDRAPASRGDGVPALVTNRAAALVEHSVPALLGGEAPALVTNEVPTLLTNHVPALVADDVSALLTGGIPALPTDELSTALTEQVPALLADEVSALLGTGVDTLLGDTTDTLLGDRALAGLGDEVTAVLGDGVPALLGGDGVLPGLGDLGVLDTTSSVFAPAQVLIDVCGSAIGLIGGAQTGCAGGVTVIR